MQFLNCAPFWRVAKSTKLTSVDQVAHFVGLCTWIMQSRVSVRDLVGSVQLLCCVTLGDMERARCYKCDTLTLKVFSRSITSKIS